MSDFDDFLSEVDEFGFPLFEMANLDPETHGLGFNVMLNVTQPGDNRQPHGPRVKVFRRTPNEKGAFVIRLNIDPAKVLFDPACKDPFMKEADINALVRLIRKYRIAFLFLSSDQGMTVGQARKIMDLIDAGNEAKLPTYPIQDMDLFHDELVKLGVKKSL